MSPKRCSWVLAALASAGAVQAQTLTVFAAASLKESVTRIARRFEATHPGTTVVLNFAGSQQLVAQLRSGAQADVMLSAGFEAIRNLTYKPDSLRLFALNRLVAIVPSSDRTAHSFRDLDRLGSIVVADKAVPVGNYTQIMLTSASKRFGANWRAQVEGHIVSREQDVRSVLAKVELAEADAGIVYTTDARAASGKVNVVPIPNDLNIQAEYPAVSMDDRGAQFVKELFSDASQRDFKAAGFGSPLEPRPTRLTSGSLVRLFDASTLARLPATAFTVVLHGHRESYRGYDLRPSLQKLGGRRLKLKGADQYEVQLNLGQCLEGGCYLVTMKDGNLEIFLPNQPPKAWVRWLRSIDLR
ncbi:MAG: molybdate ABC transporter substrate-binding protein [Fimbriimonas sp.]|nr:molybdate ABC transporter substrate-binding protein [Fimbriimonas sp.]